MISLRGLMIYAIIFLLLWAIERRYFRFAEHYNIVTKQSSRSSHTGTGIQGGGIIFLFGALLYYFLFPECNYNSWAMAGLLLIGVVSYIDDVRPLSIKIRLIAQFLAVLLMFMQLGLIGHASWWVIALALIGCVGMINAYNFMDGINGITGGYSLAVLLPLIYLNFREEYICMPYLYVAGISLLVFCFFNFRKRALCFAGDVGAISMSFILLFALGMLIISTRGYYYVTFLALYGVDAVMTIFHRMLLHENLGEAHRKHAYQLMANELRLPHLVVATFYMGCQLLISAGLLFLPVNPYLYMGIVVGALAIAYILFMKRYYHLHAEYLKSLETKKK